MTAEPQRLLASVSRSFYLTLRVLPSPIRHQIGLAYLLARATDTVADTDVVSVEDRVKALAALRDRILGQSEAPLDWREWMPSGPRAPALNEASRGTAAEAALLRRTEEWLNALRELQPEDRERVREVLNVIIEGQTKDLIRFAGATAGKVRALTTAHDLDDYTFLVAGCVGAFWTKMCRAHLFPEAALDRETLMADGIRFGKGLQLVNILRDLAGDLRHGRCYLPETSLGELGLRPQDLLDSGMEARMRPLFDHWLETARGHLRAGWDYTNALPPRWRRLRLACAWPILIGLRTIRGLTRVNVLDPSRRVKISRREVRSIVMRSLWAQFIPSVWRGQFERWT